MDQAQYKALFNETIRAYRLAGKKFNVHDLLADIELGQLAKERHANNGNGAREPERVMCWCAEGIINGQRIPVHKPTDCEYVAARSALVYEASRIATGQVGDPVGSAAVGRKWTAEFNRAMDRLAFNAGLLR